MIIVGIDYSKGSAMAAAVAMQIAAEKREPSRLIHVAGSRVLDEPAQDDAGDWLHGLGLVAADVEVRKGVPWIELVRAAGEPGASLLVAGTHGRSGFQPLRLGTTAELLALRSPTPVVLVPFAYPVAQAAGNTNSSFTQEEN